MGIQHGIAKRIFRKHHDAEFHFTFGFIEYVDDFLGGMVRGREIQFHGNAADQELVRGVVGFIRTEAGMCRIGRGVVAAPHFLEFQHKSFGQRLVLDADHVVEIPAQVVFGVVQRSGDHPGVHFVGFIDDDEFVVHDGVGIAVKHRNFRVQPVERGIVADVVGDVADHHATFVRLVDGFHDGFGFLFVHGDVEGLLRFADPRYHGIGDVGRIGGGFDQRLFIIHGMVEVQLHLTG